MNPFYRLRLTLLPLLFPFLATAQQLQPGFDKAEYIDLLKVAARQFDSLKIAPPQRYRQAYRSPVLGLDNRWELWLSPNRQAVISLRGTTLASVGWLENLYAAMVPAKGELQLSQTATFRYEVARHPRATVHVGWLVGTAFLAADIAPKLDSCLKAGVRDLIVTGHSQGGALAFLLTAHLRSLQRQGALPPDLRMKTYASAGPKPGNLYFAYDYENDTKNGWGLNVVNSADWVPEVPFSLQTASDFNPVNPFTDAKEGMQKLGFPKRIVLKHVYNRLTKPSYRALRRYQNYMGRMASKSVRKALPDFQPPAYAATNHYVRTGQTIVLYADDAYYAVFPDDKKQLFIHHLFEPYLFLAERR